MISKIKHEDEKFVTILAEKVIKPLIISFVKEENDSPVDENIPNVNSVSVKGKQIRLLKCPYCDKTLFSSPGLKDHITKKHRNSQQNKKELGKEENPIIDLSQEEAKEQGNILIRELKNTMNDNLGDTITLHENSSLKDDCEDGEFVLNSDNELQEHINEEHILRCVICDKQLKGKTVIREHSQSEHTEKGVKCKDCEVQRNTEESIKTHNENKHEKKCGSCNYVAIATRKYAAFQLLQKHKISCKSCPECELTVKDSVAMRKHLRDQHEILSVSISPPLKRKRKLENRKEYESEKSKNLESEPMEIEENELNASFQEMEIDDKDTKSIKERSDQMDAKVIEKQKSTEIEDFLRKRKEDIDDKKRKEEEKIIAARDTNRKRKQSLKDSRRRNNKKKNKVLENNSKYTVPNIREIPSNCKHLVKDNDVLYVVPGDGCCGPNCGAAHLFKDEVYGPKLRRKMNKFAAEHFNDGRYKYIANCSPENPFIRKLGGKEIIFTDQEKLIRFLNESEEAAFMWTENEDLAILSDLYQLNIKIITTNRNGNVTENWIYPDPELKKFSELQNVKIEDMVLIHENDYHFNLVVDKNSDLAQLGSLSFRFNVGPMLVIEEDIVKNEEEEKESIKDDFAELLKVKKELQKCQKSKANIEEEYMKCAKELKLKTEQVVKLTSEVKDLQEIVKLRMEMKENVVKENPQNKTEHIEDDVDSTTCKFQSKSNSNLEKHMNKEHVMNCTECGKLFHDENDLQEHKKSHSLKHIRFSQYTSQQIEEEEFNCEECDFQTNNRYHLQKHISLKHLINCKFCGKLLKSKEELMEHRKSQHPGAVKQCEKYQAGTCIFSAKKCWWHHNTNTEVTSNEIHCFICGKTFQSRGEVMLHRKSMHVTVVKQCEKFQQQNCRWKSESCWFLHEMNDLKDFQEVIEDKVQEVIEEKNDSPQVFRKDLMNPKPPYKIMI